MARPPSFDRRSLYLAMAAGVILFSAGFTFSRNGDGATFPLLAFAFTPLFVLPLTVLLLKHRQIGVWGTLIFLFGLTAAHFLAVIIADGIYDYGLCFNGDAAAEAACEAKQTAAKLALRAPVAGFCAGIAGAGASFALLLLLRALRSRERLMLMAGAALVLGCMGAIGLWVEPPENRSALSFVFGLFVPWQLLFGATIVMLFDNAAISALSQRFIPRSSPSHVI